MMKWSVPPSNHLAGLWLILSSNNANFRALENAGILSSLPKQPGPSAICSVDSNHLFGRFGLYLNIFTKRPSVLFF